MDEINKGEGRTVLFVSHQLDMIKAVCHRGLMLKNGEMIFLSDSTSVIQKYLEDDSSKTTNNRTVFLNKEETTEVLFIKSAQILNSENQPASAFDTFEDIYLSLQIVSLKEISGSIVYLELKKQGITLFFSFDTDSNSSFLNRRPQGEYTLYARIPKGTLRQGLYTLSIGTGIANIRKMHHLEDILQFEVILTSKASSFLSYADKRPGLVVSPCIWTQKLP